MDPDWTQIETMIATQFAGSSVSASTPCFENLETAGRVRALHGLCNQFAHLRCSRLGIRGRCESTNAGADRWVMSATINGI
jgi:hypothetical protein